MRRAYLFEEEDNRPWQSWPAIPNYSRYAISKTGVIVRRVPMKTRTVGTALKGHIDPQGYHRVMLVHDNNKKMNVGVHRLVAITYIGEQPSEEEFAVLHKDDVKSNNHYLNLYWGTPVDNQQDSIRNGTFHIRPSGDDHPAAKINFKIANEMRALYDPKSGVFMKHLAEKYNVTLSLVSLVIRNEIWT